MVRPRPKENISMSRNEMRLSQSCSCSRSQGKSGCLGSFGDFFLADGHRPKMLCPRQLLWGFWSICVRLNGRQCACLLCVFHLPRTGVVTTIFLSLNSPQLIFSNALLMASSKHTDNVTGPGLPPMWPYGGCWIASKRCGGHL